MITPCWLESDPAVIYGHYHTLGPQLECRQSSVFWYNGVKAPLKASVWQETQEFLYLSLTLRLALSLRPDSLLVQWGQSSSETLPPGKKRKFLYLSLTLSLALSLRPDSLLVQWGQSSSETLPPGKEREFLYL
ncbi:hypothetical protein J6590_029256 [Homalodisca vitripennis]|nr:hypothetical protein J6590_029256 [Homalodisca vitripennis]